MRPTLPAVGAAGSLSVAMAADACDTPDMPDKGNSILLTDLPGIENFWVLPSNVTPYLAHGTVPETVGGGGHPWVSQCQMHQDKPIVDTNAMLDRDKSAYEERHYLYISLELGHLYFKPVTVHGKPVEDIVLRTEQQFHVTLAYLPVGQRELISTIRQRLEQAVDEWIRFRDRPLERPHRRALIWDRLVYYFKEADDRKHIARAEKIPISQFSPDQLVYLADQQRLDAANLPGDLVDLPLSEQLVTLQRTHWKRVQKETQEEMRVTNWRVGTAVENVMIGVRMFGNSVGHISEKAEIRSLLRYMRACIKTNCILPRHSQTDCRMKLATDLEYHASWHPIQTTGGKGVKTVDVIDDPWSDDWIHHHMVRDSEAFVFPPFVDLAKGLQQFSFVSLGRADKSRLY